MISLTWQSHSETALSVADMLLGHSGRKSPTGRHLKHKIIWETVVRSQCCPAIFTCTNFLGWCQIRSKVPRGEWEFGERVGQLSQWWVVELCSSAFLTGMRLGGCAPISQASYFVCFRMGTCLRPRRPGTSITHSCTHSPHKSVPPLCISLLYIWIRDSNVNERHLLDL